MNVLALRVYNCDCMVINWIRVVQPKLCVSIADVMFDVQNELMINHCINV